MLLAKQTDICNSRYFTPLLDGTLRLTTHFTPGMPFYNEVAGCINAADEVCRTNPPAFQLVIKGQLFPLFSILISNCCETSASRKNQKSLEKMKRIIKYIETNYASKISIGRNGRCAGLKPVSFYEVFQKYHGNYFYRIFK